MLIFWAVPACIGGFSPRLAVRSALGLGVKLTGLKNRGFGTVPSQNNVEASAAPVAPMCRSNGGNPRRMARRLEPVVDRRANFAPLDGGSALPGMACDQQDHSLSSGNRALQPGVDRAPRAVEVHSMQVDDAIRLDFAGTQAPVPARIERTGRGFCPRRRPRRCRCRRNGYGFRSPGLRRFGSGLESLARQRADRRCDPVPQRPFVRVERSHGRRCPSGSARAHSLSMTCHRQSPSPPARRPRRYRPGWRP